MTTPRSSPLVVVVVHPDLLGTYGDGGNGVVLARRAAWRGIDVELLLAHSDEVLPSGDLYCLGGGEDAPQVRSAESLRSDRVLERAHAAGAVVFGVCAGYQLLGREFPDGMGAPHAGLGLLDVATRKGAARRAVGEVVATPRANAPTLADGISLPALTGFENHGGVTTVGQEATALADVVTGIGNGSGDSTEGAWSGSVLGTYLHGPVLARNPRLADLLLGWALGTEGTPVALDPLDDGEVEALRAERLDASTSPRRRWRFRPRR
jgi:lipid II isoglutaminyl synthase (glutamine-hydrolysing)